MCVQDKVKFVHPLLHFRAVWTCHCILPFKMECSEEDLEKFGKLTCAMHHWNSNGVWAANKETTSVHHFIMESLFPVSCGKKKRTRCSESCSTDSLSKDYGWYSRLKNMALTIMAPSGFCTSLVISGSLPLVALAAHSLMEFTALLLSLKLIFEWS